MKFYEQRLIDQVDSQPAREYWTYTVDDLFGTIVITSNERLKSLDLDTITNGILTSGFTGGQIKPGLTFDWEKKQQWSEDDKEAHEYLALKPQSHSTRSRGIALALCLVLGGLGIHRFYLGRNKSAVLILICTISFIGIPVSIILAVADALMLTFGGMHDAEGMPLTRW